MTEKFSFSCVHACVRACVFVCLFVLFDDSAQFTLECLFIEHSFNNGNNWLLVWILLFSCLLSLIWCESEYLVVESVKATAKNGCKCERFDTVIFTTATANGYESANSIFGLCANVCTMHSEYIKWLLCTFYQNFQESFTIGKNRIN